MQLDRDYPTYALGFIGLISIALAIKISLEGLYGRVLYVFLIVQLLILAYLVITLGSKLRNAWTNYRWSPNRLK